MKDALNEHLQVRFQRWKDCIHSWLNRRFRTAEAQSIADDEQLARFVLFSKHVSALDQRIKPEAFIPHPYPDLSVTRHRELSEKQLWNFGLAIASARKRTLYGRADVSAVTVRQQTLMVEPHPVKGNPNHANILGWPKEKPAQKIIALKLAAASAYRSYATKTP